jgi:hypothetical protein
VRASEIFEIFLPRLLYRARAFLAEEEEENNERFGAISFARKGKREKSALARSPVAV